MTRSGNSAGRLPMAVLAISAAVVYANVLLNSFSYDDFLYVLNNQGVTNPTLRGFFTATRFTNVFRPVTFATFSLNWKLGNIHAVGYHLFNLLLHIGVTLLLYLLLKKLLENIPDAATLSFVAALLFAVHPIHTEAVASIVGRSELLAAGFVFATWLFHLEDHLLPSLVCFGLALMSKESAISFVPLVLIGDYLRGKFKSRAIYLWITLVAVAYTGVLWAAQGGRFGEFEINFLDNPLAKFPPGLRLLNALRIAWKYVGLLLYPAALSCDYSYNAIKLYSDLWHTLPVALLTLAVIALWIWTLRTRRTPWALAGALYFAAFATTSNVLIPTGTIMGERLAYLPSAGFCLLVALLWFELRKRASTAAWVVLAVILCAFGARTVVRNRDWRSNFTLYSAAVRVVPDDSRMQCNLGGAYLDAGQLDLARQHLQIALQIYPSYPDAAEYLGLAEIRSGNDSAGLPLLEHAVAVTRKDSPRYGERVVNLAAMYLKLGKNDAALPLLNDAITADPQNVRAWSNRAVVYYRKGDLASARNDAETALRLDPSNSQAKSLLSAMSGFRNFVPAK
jgi:tetratricopeptide (TPR) repeat protein